MTIEEIAIELDSFGFGWSIRRPDPKGRYGDSILYWAHMYGEKGVTQGLYLAETSGYSLRNSMEELLQAVRSALLRVPTEDNYDYCC